MQGSVVYVIGEGLGRFKLRILAWKQHHRISKALPFYGWDQPINLLDALQVDQFIAAVTAVKPALVVIDTLSRCMVGANENSVEVMTEAVAACDRIRTRLGTTLLILHHMNKSGESDRGSTAMPGALDTQLFLRFKTRKMKNGEGESSPVRVAGRIYLTTKKQKDLDDIQ